MQTDKLRIFISHAWEDKLLVRRLEAELQAAGAEVWVDHTGIRGGDNLPDRISEALEWCNTLLLIWSDAASESRWVKLEWTNAISLEKAIIPCQLSTAKLPAILAHKAYVDFRNVDQGVPQLLLALKLARQTTTTAPAKNKPPQLLLRAKPLDNLSDDAVQKMLEEKGFYDRGRNVTGNGLHHEYEKIERQGQKLVIDYTTGLMWQESGSSTWLTYADTKKYIHDLNTNRFAGYGDWRLPTLEEAMSLMEPKLYGDLYINPIFVRTQQWIWTADKESSSTAWVASFSSCDCDYDSVDDVWGETGWIRAVRRGQSNIF